jgi:hypothetical protein
MSKVALGESVTVDWWNLFQSPDLTLLVKQAIAGSPTLESAKARLAKAQEAVMAASGPFYSQVSSDAGIARQKVGATTFGLTPSEAPLPPNFNLFQVGPTVSYALARHVWRQSPDRTVIRTGRLSARSDRRNISDPQQKYGGLGNPGGRCLGPGKCLGDVHQLTIAIAGREHQVPAYRLEDHPEGEVPS